MVKGLGGSLRGNQPDPELKIESILQPMDGTLKATTPLRMIPDIIKAHDLEDLDSAKELTPEEVL